MSEKVVSDGLFTVIREKLQSGGSVRLTVTGSSMYPYFRDRADTVVLLPVSSRIKKNDIVFYQRENGTYVLHRVIRTEDGYLYCRGDNQFGVPEKVGTGSVIGTVGSYTSKGKTYTDRSFRSRAVLFRVRSLYIFRRLYRKLSKNGNKRDSGYRS